MDDNLLLEAYQQIRIGRPSVLHESANTKPIVNELAKAMRAGFITDESYYKLILGLHLAEYVGHNPTKYPDLITRFGTELTKLFPHGPIVRGAGQPVPAKAESAPIEADQAEVGDSSMGTPYA